MSKIVNFDKFEPFADAAKGDESAVQDGMVHIQIQQRNGRKTLTTIQGLSTEHNLKKIVKDLKKELACNGTVINQPEYGLISNLRLTSWISKSGEFKQISENIFRKYFFSSVFYRDIWQIMLHNSTLIVCSL